MRRLADRCAPSEFVALTTAPSGTSATARAVVRSWVVTFVACRWKLFPPGREAQTGIAPSQKFESTASVSTAGARSGLTPGRPLAGGAAPHDPLVQNGRSAAAP